MAATRTGTASQIDASAGNGSTTVTVPADCNYVSAKWDQWDSNGGSSLATLTLNGVGLTIRAQLAEGATFDESGVGIATLANPATGSQTVAWTWSAGGARTEGGKITLVWCTGVDTSGTGFRDAQVNATTAANDCAATVASNTGDLVLAQAQSFTGTNPALTGTVFLNDQLLNSHVYDYSEITAGAATTAVTMTGENYSTIAGISIISSAAGGSNVNLLEGKFGMLLSGKLQ